MSEIEDEIQRLRDRTARQRRVMEWATVIAAAVAVLSVILNLRS
jgi:hypothetical protein